VKRSRHGACRLSPRTEVLIGQFFQLGDQTIAKHLLMGEPFGEGSGEFCSERLCFAAIRLSQGSMEKLERAVDLAQGDFRDLLMEAGFGHDIHAHDAWFKGERIMQRTATPAEIPLND
jgi:hypothetical protein